MWQHYFVMNLPNILTILRTLLTFVCVALLCVDAKYTAFSALIIYIIAGSTDWFDGYLARKYNVVTVFGKFMDALSDKIMVATMFMTLFAFDMYHNFVISALVCAIISMTREFAVSGIRMIASKAGVVLAAETIGKYKAGFQMYSIGATICAFSLKIDFNASDTILYYLSFYSGIATLYISTILSIWSGVGYIKRYAYLLKA